MKGIDMTFEELTAKWKEMEVPHVSDEVILKMTHGYNNAYRRKMWHRLANEVILALSFIQLIEFVVHYVHPPTWLTVCFYVSTAAYVATDFLGYNWQTNLGTSRSVREGLRTFLQRMKTLELLSRVVSAMVGTATAVVLGLRFASLEGRLLAWILMAPAVVVLIWLSTRRWTRRVREVTNLLKRFDESENVATP